MSIYIFSTDYISEKLLVPSLRKPKHLAWLRVLLSPIQNLWKRIFVDYSDGSLYVNYDISDSYSRNDRVIYTDKAVYECILDASAGILPTNATYWVKINDVFIGARERVKYSAQKMVFEYALNKYFQNPTAPLIYIENNFIVSDSVFVMSTLGSTSSFMPLDSHLQEDYMGLTPAYSVAGYDYTIYVPIALFTSLGSDDSIREKIVRNFADKYNLAGMNYNVDTF